MQSYLLFSQLLLLPLFLQLLLAPASGLNMQHKQQNHIHSVRPTFSMQQLSEAITQVYSKPTQHTSATNIYKKDIECP
jgi:hypothetical protein